MLDPASGIDDDARLMATLPLLEYAEFEDDESLFDRLLSAISPWLLEERGSPLYRGRVWHRIHRCAFTIGPTRQRDTAFEVLLRHLELGRPHLGDAEADERQPAQLFAQPGPCQFPGRVRRIG